jgi:carbamoyltransferase
MRTPQLASCARSPRPKRNGSGALNTGLAIQYCSREAKIDLADVTHVAVNRNSRANLLRKLRYVVLHRPDARLLFKRLHNRQQIARIPDELRALPGRAFVGKIEYVEHHLAHLASAFFASSIVCRPEEALDCFLRTKIDVLVGSGQHMIRRA